MMVEVEEADVVSVVVEVEEADEVVAMVEVVIGSACIIHASSSASSNSASFFFKLNPSDWRAGNYVKKKRIY